MDVSCGHHGAPVPRIYLLSEGHCVEQGSHQELMAKQGQYYNMASLQLPGSAFRK